MLNKNVEHFFQTSMAVRVFFFHIFNAIGNIFSLLKFFSLNRNEHIIVVQLSIEIY